MIAIAPYDPDWVTMFDAEAVRIRRALGEIALRVEHAGSTSITGMAAKPAVDIQVSVASLKPRNIYAETLTQIGYSHVNPGLFDLVYPFFQKPAEWPCTHHLHICAAGSAEERRHLVFRDYLRGHPRVASEYAKLKRQLAAAHDGTTLASREQYSL